MKPVVLISLVFVVLHEFSTCFGQSEDAALAVLASVGVGDESENGTTNATTTTAPVTTTSLPVPAANGHWRVNYTGLSQFCIMMDIADLEMEITYLKKSGNYSTLKFKAPGNTKVVEGLSSCGYNLSKQELSETLVLEVPLDNATLSTRTVILYFYYTRDPAITGDKTLDRSQVYRIDAHYTYFPEIFVDTADPGVAENVQSNGTLKQFAVLKDRSYQCNSPSSITLDDRLTLKFSGLRTQAFIANNRFDTPEACPADNQSSDLVPIIIGAVLAAVVLIVLIAYLVGRARMRRTTYESI